MDKFLKGCEALGNLFGKATETLQALASIAEVVSDCREALKQHNNKQSSKAA